MLLLLVSGVGKYHKPKALSQGSPFQIFFISWSLGPCEDYWGSSTLQGGNSSLAPTIQLHLPKYPALWQAG